MLYIGPGLDLEKFLAYPPALFGFRFVVVGFGFTPAISAGGSRVVIITLLFIIFIRLHVLHGLVDVPVLPWGSSGMLAVGA